MPPCSPCVLRHAFQQIQNCSTSYQMNRPTGSSRIAESQSGARRQSTTANTPAVPRCRPILGKISQSQVDQENENESRLRHLEMERQMEEETSSRQTSPCSSMFEPQRSTRNSLGDHSSHFLAQQTMENENQLLHTIKDRYKTELCRSFEENGWCSYGKKCQFAHGRSEVRKVVRHPKYKTEPCLAFHLTGICPYGKRCHFVHLENDKLEF